MPLKGRFQEIVIFRLPGIPVIISCDGDVIDSGEIVGLTVQGHLISSSHPAQLSRQKFVVQFSPPKSTRLALQASTHSRSVSPSLKGELVALNLQA